MNFHEAALSAILQEEAQFNRGLTRREIENLGVAFHIPRRMARDIFNRMVGMGLIKKFRKRIENGKREIEWKVNRKALRPVGNSNDAESTDARPTEKS